jgi:multidrug efflux pump subunit AcrB
MGRYNGHPATLVGIFLAPGANALEVAKSVKVTMDGIAQRFPDGLTYAIPYDTTRFVAVSIREVLKTLGEAMLLVFWSCTCSCRAGARRSFPSPRYRSR